MSTEGRLAWEPARFISTDAGGLAVELEGVSVTMLSQADDFVVAWSVKLSGATLPGAEAVVVRGSTLLRGMLDNEFDVAWRSEDAEGDG